MPLLPVPPTDRADVEAWVGEHLGDLTLEGTSPATGSPAFRGGQGAADSALATLDVGGYAARRNEVLPESRRGASRMSPYLRHGLLTLRQVWDAVADAPSRDRSKYRDELLWAEYARHVYARVGTATREALKRQAPVPEGAPTSVATDPTDPWPAAMRCMQATTEELHRDGWLVNQTRMWMASQWAVRAGARWQDGEDAFFAHLLDGSRASNRLGWQWTIGTGSGKAYGFSRWQVQKRAPELCRRCALSDACPIEGWPDAAPGPAADGPHLGRGPTPAGPARVPAGGPDAPPVEAVWLTAESLGDDDPALVAHPDAPVVFCFDEPLLASLRLSGKRLVFLAECLADLASRRDVEVRRGRVADELGGRTLAVTWAPVPGYARTAGSLDVAVEHPWPWLSRPGEAPLGSWSAWVKSARGGIA